MALYKYFNNGQSFATVDASYVAQSGEVVLDSSVTGTALTAALTSAFGSGYTDACTAASALTQIAQWEARQTPRLIRDIVNGITTPISDASSPLNGMTPAAASIYIESQIATLRAQL